MQSLWFCRFLIALTIQVIVQDSIKFIHNKGCINQHSARKLLHICHGVAYLLTWLLFDHSDESSKYLLAFIPFSMTIKMVAVVIGLLEDKDLIQSLQRANGEMDMFGVASYGVIFAFSTVYFHREFIGIYALILLCVGDGFAALIGSKYGRYWMLPAHSAVWNRDKSVVGLLSFIVCSITFGVAFYVLFSYFGIINEVVDGSYCFWMITITVTTACAEAMHSGNMDNLIVFIIPAQFGAVNLMVSGQAI